VRTLSISNSYCGGVSVTSPRATIGCAESRETISSVAVIVLGVGCGNDDPGNERSENDHADYHHCMRSCLIQLYRIIE
jgi:hypothetical protein